MKNAHFGTSTRDGIKLVKFDPNDENLRETHVPKLKRDEKDQVIEISKF